MLSKNKKWSLAVLGIVLAVIAVGIWLWLGFLVMGKSVQARDAYVKFTEREEQKARMALDKKTVSFDGGKDIYDTFIISQDKKSEVIEELESLARLAGVNYELVGAEEGKNLRLDIGVSGSFTRTQRFLKLVENQTYKTKIEKIELDRSVLAAGQGQWRMRMTISFFTDKI